jgi:pimeloyl-ACP methyl ester carboxylesterase
VARDMDVLRRAVGDHKLTFFGRSYGTYLGQVYANMFPDRVRAVTIDGVLDPIAWVGTPATASRPQSDRLRSADGASKALLQLLRLCDHAGEQRCKFAAGDPVANFDLLANRLKKSPLAILDPSGAPVREFTYGDLVSAALTGLDKPRGYETFDSQLSYLMTLIKAPASAGPQATTGDRAEAGGLPYENYLESQRTVMCSDQPKSPTTSSRQFAAAVAAADERAKYFGGFFAWMSAPCSSNAWTAHDEDAYYGPFNRRTAAPILVVGSKWDQATNYEGAVTAASLLPNSRLLSSDSWGHGAYRTSRCVTSAIDTYLLTQAVPEHGTKCVGDVQPFQDNPVSVPVVPRQ